VIALNESLATGWRKRFLPALNVILKERLPKVPQQQHKYYLPVSRDVLMNYFLDYSICQLLGHQKHHIPSDEMKKARTGLIGTQRSKVIHSCLDLGDHQLAAIIRSWPRHLLQFLMLGSVHTVDETIVPYFGKMADAEGKLRHCPNKPHDFGMWVWVLAQRLQWSGLPLSVGLLPAFFAKSQSPEEGVTQLVALVRACIEAPAGPLLLIADSLWCNGATITALQQQGVRVLISVKVNSGLIPDSLLNLANSDLPSGTTRSYHKAPYTLQVRGSANGRLFGLVTTAWGSTC
jgi:hypothetical protein